MLDEEALAERFAEKATAAGLHSSGISVHDHGQRCFFWAAAKDGRRHGAIAYAPWHDRMLTDLALAMADKLVKA